MNKIPFLAKGFPLSMADQREDAGYGLFDELLGLEVQVFTNTNTVLSGKFAKRSHKFVLISRRVSATRQLLAVSNLDEIITMRQK